MFDAASLNAIQEKVPQAIIDTFVMTGVSGLFVLFLGFPLGLLLYVTEKGGLFENAWLNRPISAIVDAVRAIPWIILIITLQIPMRALWGRGIGNEAVIFVLIVSAVPFYARMSELSFRNVDKNLIDAVRSMGASRWQLIREVIIPEAFSSIILGFTVTIISIIGASAMAGFIGGGGLGQIAISYGFNRGMTDVMIIVVAILIALNVAVQWFGNYLSHSFDHTKR
ncbi:ABC transporter permease [Bartonella sp. HY329]|uniref:methionine ABC transporter permease n=1 Tax=unclassified Bartonella TaxID=2645622 RepID=UPI0021C89167|nr:MULTISPECIES: methionine ABC transporter permease [unclassified Bartonella]UXM94810.1 ABC transporter permease [Bartonella sp. HY329]UXN09133.1 ABC transporter permease [Bartonella sp. HY328]